MAKPTDIPEAPPDGHVIAPTVLTGSMGLALAAGLNILNLLEPVDFAAFHALVGTPPEAGASTTPAASPAVLWSITAATAYAVAAVILTVPCMWRRVIVWLSTLVVIAGWLPVAAIANLHAAVAAPVIATAWSGLGALIYAARHRMPADAPAPATATPPDATD